MRPLDMLERWLRPVAMPYLAAVIAAAQVMVFVWVVIQSPQQPQLVLDPMELVPERVLAGEWWRLLTFLAVPFTLHPLWAILGWFCLVQIGAALEQYWGTARFNLFLLIGWISTIAAAFLAPAGMSTNGFIMLSVFLAFATLAPETVIRVFLVVPVKAKWLALITWIFIGFAFVAGTWGTRLAVLASVANWCAFFLPMVIQRVRRGTARALRAVGPGAGSAVTSGARTPFHRCAVCGRTDVSDPQLEFRYCGECDGAPGYCMDHLRAHEHVRKGRAQHAPVASAPPS
jgi:hypothetical protein